MRRRLLAVLLGVTCAAGARSVAAAPDCAPVSSTFQLIQRGIFERRDCTLSYCHGDARQGGLDLRAATSYATLLREAGDAEEASDPAGGYPLVVPGNPEQSLVWLVLAKKTLQRSDLDVPPMPQDGVPLSRESLEGLRLWILAGAPETGVVDGVADLIDPCPPTSAAGDDISGLPQCKWGDPSLLLPSLAADPPADVRVLLRNGKRRMEFTTRVGNTGDGPLILQAATRGTPGHTVDAMQVILRADGSKCVHRAGTMRFTGEGGRWQYGNFADFELRKDDPVNGPVLATASKPAFCLVDSDSVRGYVNMPIQYELRCTDPIGRMGISVGYKDTYSRVVPTQWIDLDADPDVPIEAGTYFLTNIADPSNHLWEKDDRRDDNASYSSVKVGFADPDPPGVGRTPLPTASTGVAPTARPRPEGTVRPRPTLRPRPTRAVRTVPPRPERTPRPRPTLRTSPDGPANPTSGAAPSGNPGRPQRPARPLPPQHPAGP